MLPDAGVTVAFSDTVTVGTRPASWASVASAVTLKLMVPASPLISGAVVTMLLASTEASKVKEVISASFERVSSGSQDVVSPRPRTAAAVSRRCFIDKLLIIH